LGGNGKKGEKASYHSKAASVKFQINRIGGCSPVLTGRLKKKGKRHGIWKLKEKRTCWGDKKEVIEISATTARGGGE